MNTLEHIEYTYVFFPSYVYELCELQIMACRFKVEFSETDSAPAIAKRIYDKNKITPLFISEIDAHSLIHSNQISLHDLILEAMNGPGPWWQLHEVGLAKLSDVVPPPALYERPFYELDITAHDLLDFFSNPQKSAD